MAVMDGHAVVMHPRPGVDAEALDGVRQRLVFLLGDSLVDCTVAEGPVLSVHVAVASRLSARSAVSAALEAMGAAHLFVAGVEHASARSWRRHSAPLGSVSQARE
jgi:hypothetical protein